MTRTDLREISSASTAELEVIRGAEARLTEAADVLADAVSEIATSGGDMAVYSDGRRVCDSITIDGPGLRLVVWHPDPSHEYNQPHEIGYVTTESGERKRVIVSAPGHLDVVSDPYQP